MNINALRKAHVKSLGKGYEQELPAPGYEEVGRTDVFMFALHFRSDLRGSDTLCYVIRGVKYEYERGDTIKGPKSQFIYEVVAVRVDTPHGWNNGCRCSTVLGVYSNHSLGVTISLMFMFMCMFTFI